MFQTMSITPKMRSMTKCRFTRSDKLHPTDSNSPKPIFNATSYMPYTISIQEARDAYECCCTLTGQSKKDCYLSLGVDARATEEYLQIVENYEQLYKYNKYIPNHLDIIRNWFHSIGKVNTPSL